MATYFFFIDESGNPNPDAASTAWRPFVLAGIMIPADVWHAVDEDLRTLKAKFGIVGELKFSDFGIPPGRGGLLSDFDRTQRATVRAELCRVISCRNSVAIVAAIATPAGYAQTGWFRNEPDGVYIGGLKALSERFQYHLQDLSRTTGSNYNGVLVCDARSRKGDQALRDAFAELKRPGMPYSSNYSRIIEGLFLEESRLSTGLQLADIAAGAIARHAEVPSDPWFGLIERRIRRSSAGSIDGFGIVSSF